MIYPRRCVFAFAQLTPIVVDPATVVTGQLTLNLRALHHALTIGAGLAFGTLDPGTGIGRLLALAQLAAIGIKDPSEGALKVTLKLRALNDALSFDAGLTVRALYVSA